MPWRPLPRIAFAVAIYPFQPSGPHDLPLELGDELYIIEHGGKDGSWYRGYLVAPPSLLAGLTSVKGQTLEARVFSGIFPRNCVEVREVLGDAVFSNDPTEKADAGAGETDGQLNGHASNGTAVTGDDFVGPHTPVNDRTFEYGSPSKRPLTDSPGSKMNPRKASGAPRPIRRAPSLRSSRSQRSRPVTVPEMTMLPPRDPNTPRPPAPVPMLKVGDETPTSVEEPLVDEIASCLREWHSTNLHDLFLARQYPVLEKISNLVRKLDFARRQLLHEVLTNHELRRLREKVVWQLVRANKLLGSGVVVRDPARRGRIMTGEDSAIEITRLQSMMSLLHRSAMPKMTIGADAGGAVTLPRNGTGSRELSKDDASSTGGWRPMSNSSAFTPDQALGDLLAWRERAPAEVLDLLQRVCFVSEVEIVKLLNEVLDALFAILVDRTGEERYEDLVFNALVHVLGIVHDRRFNLGPSVDQYALEQFSFPCAATCLIRSFTRLLINPTDSECSRKLRATFKVGRHIFRFIVCARKLLKDKEAGIGIKASIKSNLTDDLQSIFRGLETLMKRSSPVLVGSQTLAVQHFHTWIPEFMGFLTVNEVIDIVVDFMDCCADVKSKLILYKLILLTNFSRLDIFREPSPRQILLARTPAWLAPYWGKTDQVTDQWQNQVRLCCTVLSMQVDDLRPQEVTEYVPKIIDSYRMLQSVTRHGKDQLSLLFPTAYPFPTKPISGRPVFNEGMIELSAILAAIAPQLSGIHVKIPQEEMAEFLLDTLQVSLSILDCEAFPRDWISTHIYHHQTAMKVLEYLGGVLLELFLPDPDHADTFHTELWLAFFTTLLKLVGSGALALETFPEQKRRAVWKIAGDVREQGADLLRRTWTAIGWETSAEERQKWEVEKLGGYQVQYVPGLVTPIVELCLSVHGGLRRVAVEVLHAMIIGEWTLSQDLSAIQAEMIDCLDRLSKAKPLNESILQKLFIEEIMQLFEPLSQIPDDALYVSLRSMVSTIDDFLNMLVAVHGSETTGEASSIIQTLRLMDFLKDMQKEDMSIQYVHQLARVQAQAHNSAEAGLALRLHADLYSWDPTQLVPSMSDPFYPEQTMFERKEALYFEMVKHFEDGRSWENALAAYKELAEQYENNVFDLAKLARTQRAMAKGHEAIVRGDRQSAKYFRVMYSGLGFPLSLREKQFIYEGAPAEKLSNFTERMSQEHPSAQIVAAVEGQDVEGQYMQISVVGPHRDLLHPVYRRSKVPQAIREYHLSTWPNTFALTTRRVPGNVSVNEQWVEKTLFTTAEAFPTILKRSEILVTEQIRLTPIQTAIERTHRKAQELATIEKTAGEMNGASWSTLTDMLALAIKPNSETNVARYRDLLPNPEDPTIEDLDDDEDAEAKPEVDAIEADPLHIALRMAMIDYAVIVKRCLAAYSRADDPQMKIIQRDQTHRFESTFAPELASFASPTPQPNPRHLSSSTIRHSSVVSPTPSSLHPANQISAADPNVRSSIIISTPRDAAPPSITRSPHLDHQSTTSSSLSSRLENLPPAIHPHLVPSENALPNKSRLSLSFLNLKTSTTDLADLLNFPSYTSSHGSRNATPTITTDYNPSNQTHTSSLEPTPEDASAFNPSRNSISRRTLSRGQATSPTRSSSRSSSRPATQHEQPKGSTSTFTSTTTTTTTTATTTKLNNLLTTGNHPVGKRRSFHSGDDSKGLRTLGLDHYPDMPSAAHLQTLREAEAAKASAKARAKARALAASSNSGSSTGPSTSNHTTAAASSMAPTSGSRRRGPDRYIIPYGQAAERPVTSGNASTGLSAPHTSKVGGLGAGLGRRLSGMRFGGLMAGGGSRRKAAAFGNGIGAGGVDRVLEE